MLTFAGHAAVVWPFPRRGDWTYLATYPASFPSLSVCRTVQLRLHRDSTQQSLSGLAVGVRARVHPTSCCCARRRPGACDKAATGGRGMARSSATTGRGLADFFLRNPNGESPDRTAFGALQRVAGLSFHLPEARRCAACAAPAASGALFVPANEPANRAVRASRQVLLPWPR